MRVIGSGISSKNSVVMDELMMLGRVDVVGEDTSQLVLLGEENSKFRQTVMATSTEVIVDLDEVSVDFTELPPVKLCCPVCDKVFRDPHKTSCCNTTYCRKCLDKTTGGPCPSCSEDSWELVIDESSQRNVNDLYVRCLHVTDGCLWFGRLEQLPRHIDKDNKSGCIFIKLSCPHNCGEKHARKVLQEHAKNRCLKRPYTCEYCSENQGIFEDIQRDHFPACPSYPVPCPNKCPDRTVPRSQLEDHVKNTCQYQENIPCVVSFAGCEVKLQRKNIPGHLEKNIASHITMMSTAFVDFKKEVEDKIEALPSEMVPKKVEMDGNIEEFLKSKDQEIRQLKLQVQQLQREKEDQDGNMHALLEKMRRSLDLQEQRLSLMEQQNHTLTRDISRLRQFVPTPLPITFTINKFDQLRQSGKWWYSRPFYSHVGGYKLGMFVFCNGVLDGKGSHLSVFLYIVRGEYDDDLDWPFLGNVTIHLLNQRGDRQHYQKVIRFTEDTPPGVCNRVIDKEMAKEGNGPTQFIAHGDLSYNPEKDTEFVRDDCLKIRVSSISLKGNAPRTPAAGSVNTGTLPRHMPSGFTSGHGTLKTDKTISIDSADEARTQNGPESPVSPVVNGTSALNGSDNSSSLIKQQSVTIDL